MIHHPLLSAAGAERECTMRETIDDLRFMLTMALVVLGSSGLAGVLH